MSEKRITVGPVELEIGDCEFACGTCAWRCDVWNARALWHHLVKYHSAAAPASPPRSRPTGSWLRRSDIDDR